MQKFNFNLETDCLFTVFNSSVLSKDSFDCGDGDLNDFFNLGVNLKYKSMGVGSQILDFIKAWFVSDKNKTGCRFIIVDAYNNEKSYNFYIKNGFSFLFKDENAEKIYNNINEKELLKTRLMYFDLITIL